MDDPFDEAAWFDGLAELLEPDSNPSWCKNVCVGHGSVTVVVAAHVLVDDLSVDVGQDALVVRCAQDPEALVLRDVQVDVGAGAVRWSSRRHTLRAAIRHGISIESRPCTGSEEAVNAATPTCEALEALEATVASTASPYTCGQNVPLAADPSETGREQTARGTSDASSVSEALQGAFAAIKEFDRRVSRVSQFAARVHEKTLAVVGRDAATEPQATSPADGGAVEGPAPPPTLHPISVEGLQLVEDPEMMYGSWVVSTGQILWPAASALIRTLRAEPGLLPDHGGPFRVLEIGAGLGAPGLFIAKHWPMASVVLTDVEGALPLLAKNVATAFPEGAPGIERVELAALPWGPTGEAACAALERPDVVLGSDICYRRDLMDLVLWTLCRLRAPRAVLALADRSGSLEDFAAECARREIKVVGTPWKFEGADIWRLDAGVQHMAQTDVYVYNLEVPQRSTVLASNN